MSQQEQQQNGRNITTRRSNVLSADAVRSQELVSELLETDVPEEILQLFSSELSRDHVLGNLKDEELHEYRYFVKNSMLMVKAKFPPPESAMQGELRDVVYDDDREPLNTDQLHKIRDAPWISHQRASRSKDFGQQKLITEQTKRQVVDDLREKDEGGSIFSRIFGGK